MRSTLRARALSPDGASPPPRRLRAHTLAVNDTGIAFVKAAREHDGDNCGALSWRHEIAHPLTGGGPQWRVYYRTFPDVLVVLADQTPTHAQRRIQRVIALYRTDPTQSRYGTVPILS